MHSLDKRVTHLERASNRRDCTAMSDAQLLACLSDPRNPNRIAALLEQIYRSGGSRLPVRVNRAA